MKKICVLLTGLLGCSVSGVMAVHLTSTVASVNRHDSGNSSGKKRKAPIYCGESSKKAAKRSRYGDKKAMSSAPKITDVQRAFDLAIAGKYNSSLASDLAPDVRTACARINSPHATQLSRQLMSYSLSAVCKHYWRWGCIDIFPGDNASDIADTNALLTFILCSNKGHAKEHRKQLSFNTKGIELLLLNLEKTPIQLNDIDISITFDKMLTFKTDKQVELFYKVLDAVKVITCYQKTLSEELCHVLCEVISQKITQFRPIRFTFTLSSFLNEDLRKKFLSTVQYSSGFTHFSIACPCAQLDTALQKDSSFLKVFFSLERNLVIIESPAYARKTKKTTKVVNINDEQLANVRISIG